MVSIAPGIAAGGIGSPRILQKSELEEAGQGMYLNGYIIRAN
jgi:hypothetical protein